MSVLKDIARSAYYSVYGKSGISVKINNEDYVVSAHVARGLGSVIDEVPLKLLSNLCKEADVLFDIGANIGIIAMILAKKMKPGTTIYSFEPAPVSFKYLADTARVQKGNAKIKAENVAISNEDGKLYFTNDGHSCTNHVATADEAGVISVDAITMDSFCKHNKVVPQVVKVDVEGAEYLALQGMRDTLKNNNCTVLMEMHLIQLKESGVSGQMFADIIDEVGYKAFSETGAEIASNEVMSHACVILAREKPGTHIFNI